MQDQKWCLLVFFSREHQSEVVQLGIYIQERLQFKSKELSSGVVQGSSILQKGCLACHATGHGQYESMFIYLEIYNIIWRCACSAEGPFCIWSLVLNTPTVNSPSAHTTLTVQRSNGLPHRAIPRSSFRELAEAASECARFPLPPGPTQDGESPRVLVHAFSVYRAETMRVVSGQAVPPFPLTLIIKVVFKTSLRSGHAHARSTCNPLRHSLTKLQASKTATPRTCRGSRDVPRWG